MRNLVLMAIAALVGTAIFQNCGKAFEMGNVASSAPSVFPTNYTPYGGIPSQGLTALPPANKVKARSSATTGTSTNLLTCTQPPCYR